MTIVFILLAVILAWNILLFKTYLSVPLPEIKRRAQRGDKRARSLYKVASYGEIFYLREWLFGTAITAVLVIWSARTAWWLAVIAIVIISWLAVWLKLSAESWAGGLAAAFAPFDAWLLSVLRPVLDPFTRWLPNRGGHTGLYEKKDLRELLQRQLRQTDNRIDEKDLSVLVSALDFGDKTVRSIMTPRRRMKFVGAAEAVGPMLMDELHKSGFSRFPVVKNSPKSNPPEIIGTLCLNDIVGNKDGGKVSDFIRKDTSRISEDADLRQALNVFLDSNQLMLIVVNNFDEIVGQLNLEDVLVQMMGPPAGQAVAK